MELYVPDNCLVNLYEHLEDFGWIKINDETIVNILYSKQNNKFYIIYWDSDDINLTIHTNLNSVFDEINEYIKSLIKHNINTQNYIKISLDIEIGKPTGPYIFF